MSDSIPHGRITVSVADGVASVVIDNPSQRDALTKAMCLELRVLAPWLEADVADLRQLALARPRGRRLPYSWWRGIHYVSFLAFHR